MSDLVPCLNTGKSFVSELDIISENYVNRILFHCNFQIVNNFQFPDIPFILIIFYISHSCLYSSVTEVYDNFAVK
jgi:hypothetical protein